MPMSLEKINSHQEYVEVQYEPLHREMYKDSAFRVYLATLKPGESTLYHRHSQDTIYIALKGGWLRTTDYTKGTGSPVIFPRSFNRLKQLRLGFQRLVTGSVKLSDSLAFVMLNKQRNCIHKAAASRRNSDDMRLMGIEILHRSRHQRPPLFDARAYRAEYAGEYFSMGSLTLKPGDQSGVHTQTSPFFLFCIRGIAEVVYENQERSESARKRLTAGGFLSMDSLKGMNISNTGADRVEMIVIAPPYH